MPINFGAEHSPLWGRLTHSRAIECDRVYTNLRFT